MNDYGYDLRKDCRIIWRNSTLGFCMECIKYTELYARRVEHETCHMTWWSDECRRSWRIVTRRCTMLSVDAEHGRRQKRDIVKEGKTMRDIVISPSF